MSKILSRLSVIALIVAIIIAILPGSTYAITENAEVEVIKQEDGKYIVYVEGANEFSYAISTNSNATEYELDYINSVEDGAGTQVAVISQTGTVYFWAKNGDTQLVCAKEIKLNSETFTTDDLNNVGKTTQKIPTTVKEDVSKVQYVAEGVTTTLTLSGLEIDGEETGYEYKIIPTKGNAEELMTKAKNLPEKLNTYDGVKKAKEFDALYTNLKSDLEDSKWVEAKDNMILQPETATDGENYVALVQKTDGSVEDVQFLKSEVKSEEKFEKEKIVVQETTKLPITGESLALIIAFAVVVALLVIVFIKMKKSKKEDR